MKKYSIYYYHNLNLSFKSAQTLQVIKDYVYLSKKGYEVNLFGEYKSIEDLEDILAYVGDNNVVIHTSSSYKLSKILNKINFLKKVFLDKKDKILITRHYKKIKELFLLKKISKNTKIFHEMHEESFPHLFKKKISKNYVINLFKKVDSLIFTNYSQVKLYQKEFNTTPLSYIVLPNGVEVERFDNIKKVNNFVLTYLGQFNEWKNVELLFETLSLLDNKFTLRIAGGKGDEKSNFYIKSLIKKYSISNERVNYLGFIKNSEIKNVLDKSNVLLLPLGDNIQSQYLTSPMKLFEYMATKIPVIAIDYPTINLIASNNELYLSENNAKVFSETIYSIVNNNILVDEKIKAMNKLVKKYSYKMRSTKFDEFIKSN